MSIFNLPNFNTSALIANLVSSGKKWLAQPSECVDSENMTIYAVTWTGASNLQTFYAVKVSWSIGRIQMHSFGLHKYI